MVTVRAELLKLPAACVLLAMLAAVANAQQTTGVPGPATGDACRKEICDSAVAGCMRADLSLNPLAFTESLKKGYCAQFFLWLHESIHHSGPAMVLA
jgi:hypothetical protein